MTCTMFFLMCGTLWLIVVLLVSRRSKLVQGEAYAPLQAEHYVLLPGDILWEWQRSVLGLCCKPLHAAQSSH